MAQRIPIFKDDLSFAERQGRVWGDMERDLERRRREWEDEIERMRKDFFTLKPEDNGRLESISDKFKMGDSLKDEARGVVEQDEHGRPVFRVRFNVATYKPEEVNVKIDTNKLIVHAKHEEKSGNKSVSREYSREVDLPRDIDAMALQCSISTDGVLTVEAPMPSQQYGAVKDSGPQRAIPMEHIQTSTAPPPPPSGARNTPPPPPPLVQPQQQSVQHQPQQQQQKHSSTFTTFLSGASPQKGQTTQPVTSFSPQTSPQTMSSPPPPPSASSFSNIQESDRKFKVDVDIEDFAPEELSVKTVDKKLVISARREEKLGNRTSTKELNREIHLPETVDPYSVKAFFSESGKLIVEAPYIRSVPISHYSEGFSNAAGR